MVFLFLASGFKTALSLTWFWKWSTEPIVDDTRNHIPSHAHFLTSHLAGRWKKGQLNCVTHRSALIWEPRWWWTTIQQLTRYKIISLCLPNAATQSAQKPAAISFFITPECGRNPGELPTISMCVCVPGLIKNERDAHYLDESRQRNKRTRRPHRTTNDFWAGDFSLQHPKIPPLKVRFMWMRMRVVLGFNYLWFHPSRRRSARCLSNCLPLVKMFSFCTGLEPRPDAHTSACGIWWWRKRYQICNLSERKFNENNSFSYLMISVS